MAFAAGYLEGAVDTESLWNNLLTNLESYTNYSMPQKELDWLDQNLKWTTDNAQKEGGIYWTQVGLILAQMNGVLKGYNDHGKKPFFFLFFFFSSFFCLNLLEKKNLSKAPSNQQMKLIDLIIINTGGDRCILDVEFFSF